MATSLTVPTRISILIPLHLNNRLLDEFSNEFDNIFSEIPSVCEPCISESNVKHTVQEHIITTGAPFFLRNWTSPPHMVPMSNGHSCPYGEYCAVNAATKPARYPIAHVQDFSNRLAVGTIFSNIDLVRTYHPIPVAPEDEDVPKTPIVTPFNLASLSSDLWLMDFATQLGHSNVSWMKSACGLDFVFTYIDDILIFCFTLDEHRDHLHQYFKRLEFYGLN